MKLLESVYNKIVNEEESSSNTDSHEIMTACLCMMPLNKINKVIDSISGTKYAENMPKVLAELSKIAYSRKIISASDKEKESIMTFKNKELALVQACSAAREILERSKFGKVDHVILTGKKWVPEISMFSGIRNLEEFFKINSYGMKDFNSSDIVLVGKAGNKTKFLGVSLKKKKRIDLVQL